MNTIKKQIRVLILLVLIGLVGIFVLSYVNYQNTKASKEYQIYKEVFDNLPFPAFIKDKNSIVLDVNEEYIQLLKNLKIKEDIVGTQGEIFGEKTKNIFVQHDKLVMEINTTMIFEEFLPTLGPGNSYKTPLRNSLGTPNGTFGLWIKK